MQGADLGLATLSAAQLDEAWMQGTNLGGTDLQGANLCGAHLQGARLGGFNLQASRQSVRRVSTTDSLGLRTGVQGAKLDRAEMQGVRLSPFDTPFADRIRATMGQESDLGHIEFSGGLSSDDLDRLTEGLSSLAKVRLRSLLEPHVGEPVVVDAPANVVTGAYTREDAEGWIREFECSMAGVSQAEDA